MLCCCTTRYQGVGVDDVLVGVDGGGEEGKEEEEEGEELKEEPWTGYMLA